MKVIREKYHNQLVTMPTLFPINCYLIKEKEFLTLIDCSKKGTGSQLIAHIQSENKPLKQIILTHAHSDHVGDVAELKKAFPDVKIILSETEGVDLSQKKRGLTPLGVPVDRLVTDGDVVGSLIVKATPGHTRGSITLLDVRSNVAYVGDLIQTKGGKAIAGDTRWLFPFPAWSTDDKQVAIQSFTDLIKADCPRYYCGHGPYLENNRQEFRRLLERAMTNLK